VAEALDHAHQQGVVHRDVKPSNLIVDRTGKPWVADFGLARIGSVTVMTFTGDLLGTLRYMSPEQALGKRVGVDHRTDVYSLGVTLYELLALRPAFRGRDRQRLLRQIAAEEPPPLRRLNRAVAVDLETIVLRAMAKTPADRYQRAADLAADLKRFLAAQRIEAKRPGLAKRVARWSQQHRGVAVTAALGVLVSVGALSASLGYIAQERSARRRAVEGQLTADLEAAEPLLRQGDPTQPVLATTVRSTASLLEREPLPDDLRARARQLLADAEMLSALETIRVPAPSSGTNADYATAFERYGYDVDRIEHPATAERLRGSAIAVHLAAALDDWAQNKKQAEARPTQRRLWELAAATDPDPWRNAVRDACARKATWQEWERLAATMPIEQLSPTSIVVFAVQLRNTGLIAESVAVLLKGYSRFPNDYWINLHLAFILQIDLRPPRLNESLGHWQAVLALRPKSASMHCQVGEVMLALGRAAEAVDYLRSSVQANPESARAQALLGKALAELGQYQEALACFNEAIRLDNAPFYAHFHNAEALSRMGRGDEAAQQVRTCIARLMASEDADTCNVLAWQLVAHPDPALRDPSRAVALAQRALVLHPIHGGFSFTQGVAHYRAGDWQGAIAALEESNRVRLRGTAHNFFFLAMAHCRLGHADEARDWLQQGIAWMEAKAPQDEELLRFRAEAETLLAAEGATTANTPAQGDEASFPVRVDVAPDAIHETDSYPVRVDIPADAG
jgi:tetratricopeptide (TPR) repeat protein